MRDHIRDDPSRHRAAVDGSDGSHIKSVTRSVVSTYAKVALGILVLALLVSFVVQNAEPTHVEFLVWESNMSQALVVFLTLLLGVGLGVALNRWQRWRSSHRSREG